jgi:hypothetical protein
MSEWRAEEQRIEMASNTPTGSYADRVLSARRILELANKAYFLYKISTGHGLLSRHLASLRV